MAYSQVGLFKPQCINIVQNLVHFHLYDIYSGVHILNVSANTTLYNSQQHHMTADAHYVFLCGELQHPPIMQDYMGTVEVSMPTLEATMMKVVPVSMPESIGYLNAPIPGPLVLTAGPPEGLFEVRMDGDMPGSLAEFTPMADRVEEEDPFVFFFRDGTPPPATRQFLCKIESLIK